MSHLKVHRSSSTSSRLPYNVAIASWKCLYIIRRTSVLIYHEPADYACCGLLVSWPRLPCFLISRPELYSSGRRFLSACVRLVSYVPRAEKCLGIEPDEELSSTRSDKPRGSCYPIRNSLSAAVCKLRLHADISVSIVRSLRENCSCLPVCFSGYLD